MLSNKTFFNVMASRRVNLIVGGDNGSGSASNIQLKVDALPSTYAIDAGGNPVISSHADEPIAASAPVAVGDSARINIPSVGTNYNLSTGGAAAVRVESLDARKFVAYVATSGPRISTGVSGAMFEGKKFRIPLLDAPANGSQNVKICVTPTVGATAVTITDLRTNTALVVTPSAVPPLHTFVFDQDIPGHTQLEVSGQDVLVVSALIARNNRFRIYPATID